MPRVYVIYRVVLRATQHLEQSAVPASCCSSAPFFWYDPMPLHRVFTGFPDGACAKPESFHPWHPLEAVPRNQKQKIDPDCNFFTIGDCCIPPDSLIEMQKRR